MLLLAALPFGGAAAADGRSFEAALSEFRELHVHRR
jgi:hypothetical protein